MLDRYLPARPWLAQRRKIRGKKSFFARIARRADRFALPAPDELHGFWHWHADFWGNGNRGWKYRARYIEAHCSAFKKFAENLHQYRPPYQLYICLTREDSSTDAVYFDTPDPKWHTPPHEFPFKFPEAQWGIAELEEYFAKLLAPHKVRCGYDGKKVYVYSPGIGEGLE